MKLIKNDIWTVYAIVSATSPCDPSVSAQVLTQQQVTAVIWK